MVFFFDLGDASQRLTRVLLPQSSGICFFCEHEIHTYIHKNKASSVCTSAFLFFFWGSCIPVAEVWGEELDVRMEYSPSLYTCVSFFEVLQDRSSLIRSVNCVCLPTSFEWPNNFTHHIQERVWKYINNFKSSCFCAIFCHAYRLKMTKHFLVAL